MRPSLNITLLIFATFNLVGCGKAKEKPAEKPPVPQEAIDPWLNNIKVLGLQPGQDLKDIQATTLSSWIVKEGEVGNVTAQPSSQPSEKLTGLYPEWIAAATAIKAENSVQILVVTLVKGEASQPCALLGLNIDEVQIEAWSEKPGIFVIAKTRLTPTVPQSSDDRKILLEKVKTAIDKQAGWGGSDRSSGYYWGKWDGKYLQITEYGKIIYANNSAKEVMARLEARDKASREAKIGTEVGGKLQ